MTRVEAYGADFSKSLLDEVDLTGAILAETNFGHASLLGARLESAVCLEQCDFESAKYDEKTRLYGGLEPRNIGMAYAPMDPNTIFFYANRLVRVQAPWEIADEPSMSD